MAIPWAGIGSVLGGLGGLFGGGKKGVDAGHAIRKQAWGAREAAREFGFNPLTMLQYGQPGAGMAGQAAPLASIELITGGLRDISDEASGDAERRRKAEELELDLAKVKLDQARSGVLFAPPPPVAAGVGLGPSPLGRRTITQAGEAGATPARKTGIKTGSYGTPTVGPNPIAPGRKQEIDPIINSGGVFEMENVLTGGRPITIPGEGEPWGIDELATAVIVGAPQALGNVANHYAYGGKSFDERMADYRKREKEELGKPKKAKKRYDGPGGPVFDY